MGVIVADVRIGPNGRLVLPKSVRDAIGVHGETTLVVTVEDDSVRLSPIARAVERAQALYAKHAKHDASSQDFLAERREDDTEGSAR